MACETCRLRKVKCDIIRPVCGYCRGHGTSCKYLHRQKPRRLSEKELENRLRRMESVLRSVQGGEDAANANGIHTELAAGPTAWASRQPLSPSPPSPPLSQQDIWHMPAPVSGQLSERSLNIGQSVESNSGSEKSSETTSSRNLATEHPRPLATQKESLLDSIFSESGIQPQTDRNAAIFFRGTDGDQYTGPSSGISILSELGLTWIQDNIGTSETSIPMLQSLVPAVAKHLTIPKDINLTSWRFESQARRSRSLPSADVARQYVNAYFTDVQCIFPILDRPVFEKELDEFFDDAAKFGMSWYALYNAVLALGCRAVQSAETPLAFQSSEREAREYVENYIEDGMQLVHNGTDVKAVQAFALMAVYAQGLASPQRLEFTFSSLAVRLAQGLGMHRQPLPQWCLTACEIEERNRIFWVTYCLDKTIALRSGRPAIIDDAEVSCSFPRGVQVIQDGRPKVPLPETGRGGEPFDFFLAFTRFARICGRIAKSLYSAVGLSCNSIDLLVPATELLAAFTEWRESIPVTFRPGTSFRPSTLPIDVSLTQALVINLGYNYGVCAIHKRFTAHLFQGDPSLSASSLSNVESTTSAMCVEAARSMILLTKYMNVESYTPAWLIFYYPMTAFISLFTYIICRPLAESASNDIALMEVVVGLFGRLEFITSGVVAFTKARGFVRLAQTVVAKAQGENILDPIPSVSETSASVAPLSVQEGPPQGLGPVLCDPKLPFQYGDRLLPARRDSTASSGSNRGRSQQHNTSSRTANVSASLKCMQNNQLTEPLSRPETIAELPPQLFEYPYNQSTSPPPNLNRDNQDWLAWQTDATVFEPDATVDQELSIYFAGNGLRQLPH